VKTDIKAHGENFYVFGAKPGKLAKIFFDVNL
jgi:hypothetical protein